MTGTVRRWRKSRPCAGQGELQTEPVSQIPDLVTPAGSSPATPATSASVAPRLAQRASTETEAAPGDEVRVRRDGGHRVDLEQGEMAHHVKQPARPRAGEELSADRDAARIGARELVDGHDTRLGEGGSPRGDQGWPGLVTPPDGRVSNRLTWMFESLFIDSKLCFNDLMNRIRPDDAPPGRRGADPAGCPGPAAS